jgi:chloramphenicol-sensitive protein RarD
MDPRTRSGLLLGLGAYLLWGLLPLYLKLLAGVPATQVLAHRVLWSLLLLGAIVLLAGKLRAISAAARGRTLLMLCASAALIFVNWLVFIWAVSSGHALAASLGYYINPLVNVLLGVVVLKERLSRLQKMAVAIAAAGVAAMAAEGGGLLWVPLTLAISFGTYGLVRKIAAIDALGGLTVETLLLAPICAAILVFAHTGGEGAFGASAHLDVLLALSGAVTAAPLLIFRRRGTQAALFDARADAVHRADDAVPGGGAAVRRAAAPAALPRVRRDLARLRAVRVGCARR